MPECLCANGVIGDGVVQRAFGFLAPSARLCCLGTRGPSHGGSILRAALCLPHRLHEADSRGVSRLPVENAGALVRPVLTLIHCGSMLDLSGFEGALGSLSFACGASLLPGEFRNVLFERNAAVRTCCATRSPARPTMPPCWARPASQRAARAWCRARSRAAALRPWCPQASGRHLTTPPGYRGTQPSPRHADRARPHAPRLPGARPVAHWRPPAPLRRSHRAIWRSR